MSQPAFRPPDLTDEHKMFRKTARDFVEKELAPFADEYERNKGFPDEIFKKVGDSVAVDESLLELETDKAAQEIPSPVSGVIREMAVSQGDEVKVGAPRVDGASVLIDCGTTLAVAIAPHQSASPPSSTMSELVR